MTPTNKLRWLQRGPDLSFISCGDGRVLQQWWEYDIEALLLNPDSKAEGEWRDVEVVNE